MERMRTMLFCPASKPKMYINAPIFKPDCILFDLEDSVVYDEKDSARDLLCTAMKMLDFGDSRICVRINSVRTELWKDDIHDIVAAGVRFVRLSSCESAEDVKTLDAFLTATEKEYGIEEGSVKIQCSIETAKGVMNARESVDASDRVISLSFGAEDYTRSMGTSRTKEGIELTFARTYLPVVAAEAGFSAIDTVWSYLEDEEGFETETRHAKALGFTGKSCIHPSQLGIVHRCFEPSEEEIEHARKVIDAVNTMFGNGEGVFTIDGKMIDEPVINRARRVLMMAGEGEQ